MNRTTYRNVQNLLLSLIIFVLGATFYFEYVKNLEPCPLCVMQRVCAFLFGLLCMFGLGFSTLHRARLWAIFQIILAAFGLYFALRQLWLQSLPLDAATSCMPGLKMLMHYVSWSTVLKALFWGTSDCMEVTWHWHSITIPTLSALFFSFLLTVSMIVFWRIQQTLSKNVTGY